MKTSYWVDGIILGILALSVITGLFRGFVKESVALCMWIIAIWLAATYFKEAATLLKPYISDQTIRTILAVVLIIISTVIVGSIFNAILSAILHSTGLTGTDRLFGMGFGFLRGVFIVSLVMLAIKMTAVLPAEEYARQSMLYAKFDPIVNWLYGYTPQFIKQMKVLDNNQDELIVKKSV